MPKKPSRKVDYSFSSQALSDEAALTAFEETLGSALEAEDFHRALELLDNAPDWLKKDPQTMTLRASVLLATGNEAEGLRILHELERKYPHDWAVYQPLALYYMDQESPALALHAARRVLADRELPAENRAIFEDLRTQATELINTLSARLNLPYEATEQASSFYEKAQFAMNEGKYSEVEHLTKEALKIAPGWVALRNNRAQALFFSGKVVEAIAQSQEVLQRDPENAFALSSSVFYQSGLNQMEQAQEYAKRFEAIVDKPSVTKNEMDLAISAFALVEDTPALWKIAGRYLQKPTDALSARSWYCLAVAAVRSGQWKEALRLMKKPDKEDLAPAESKFLGELEQAAGKRKPRLAWMPPVYPGIDLFFQPKIMDEWENLLDKFSDEWTPSQKRKLVGFFEKYPYWLAVIKRFLWDEDTNLMALDLLLETELPEAYDEILRFALSQTGTQEFRMQALLGLVESGQYTGPKMVKIWFEDEEEWRDIELNTQQIEEDNANIQPQTQALVEKAYYSTDQKEVISLLRQAIELEPTSPIPYFNLGITLMNSGEGEEGERLLRQSVEVDPNYTYGHAGIALMEADEGNTQEALDHLMVVAKAETVAPETIFMADIAYVRIALNQHDLKKARQYLDMAAAIIPDHSLVKNYEQIVSQSEILEKSISALRDFRHDSIQRAHQKLVNTPVTVDMGLRACLERNTKDMLVGTAHFLRVSASGKKGELMNRLAQVLLDPVHLSYFVGKKLTEKEREALRWVMEAGGVRPWEEFANQYGDDSDESPYWNYEEPKSLPGRLKLVGLLFPGALEGQTVAFIPVDLRRLLAQVL